MGFAPASQQGVSSSVENVKTQVEASFNIFKGFVGVGARSNYARSIFMRGLSAVNPVAMPSMSLEWFHALLFHTTYVIIALWL